MGGLSILWGGERLENPLEIMLVLHPYFMQVTTLLSI